MGATLLFLKQSVVGDVDPVSYAIGVVSALRAALGLNDSIVTSMNDSHHKAGSLHYVVDTRGLNKAVDLRSHDLGEGQKDMIFHQLQKQLDNIGFDIVFEGRGTDNEHFHIEFDPKPNEVFINRTT